MAEQDPFADLIPEPDLGEFADLVEPEVPPKSKSEKTLRDLSFMIGGYSKYQPVGIRVDPVGALETAGVALSGMADMSAKGLAGIAGTVAGLLPGGDSPNEKANKWLEAMPDLNYEPNTQGGATGTEMLGKGMEKATEGVKFVGSGYAAMAGGAQGQEDFMNTENALGEGVFQVTKSPVMATVAQLLPEVASMGVPASKAKVARPRPRMAPDMPPSGFGGIGDFEVPRQRPMEGGTTPIPETGPGGAPMPSRGAFDELLEAVRTKDKRRVRELVNANPAIVAAFEELGIQWSPGMVSDNAALRQLEGGLESLADTGIKQTHELARMQLNQKANDLISSVEGAGSRVGVSTEIASQFDEIQTGMLKYEGELWDELRPKVPRGTPVDAKSAADGVMRRAVEAGRNGNVDDGLRSLSKYDRELFRITHEKQPVQKTRTIDGEQVTEEVMEWVYTEPKYAAVDRLRKDLGDGMNGQGPFGTAEKGELKFLYEQMVDIQGRVAKGSEYADDWKAANNATVARKDFEDSMKRTLGRDLNFDAIARVDTAMKMLLDGKPNKWDTLFDDLPAGAKEMAAAQALDQVFFAGKKGTEMTGSFVANFNKIKRDPRIRDRIFKHLPPEVRTDFMNMGEAATGFFRALDDVNFSRTGNARNVMEQIKKPGWINRIVGGVAETGAGWVPGVGEAIRTARRSAPDAKTAAEAGRMQSVANFLNDPALRRSIVEYANGNVQRANEILRNSQSYLEWLKTQPIASQRRWEAAGIVALFDEETEE